MLNLIKEKGFFPHIYWEKFKEGLPSKDKFYDALTNRAFGDKNYEYVLNF